MLAAIKNLRFVFALLLSLSIVSLTFYFSTDRTRSDTFGQRLPDKSITSLPDHNPPRPTANSFSLDNDNDGIPDAAESVPSGTRKFSTPLTYC